MKKLFWLGALAILILAAGSAYLIWHAGEGGAPIAAAGPAAAPAAEPAAALAPGSAAQLEPPTIPGPEWPAVESATERDPRNDIQRPADRRADLLQEERLAKQDSAMDQLNRRTARRKETMQALGEVRPGAPVVQQPGTKR